MNDLNYSNIFNKIKPDLLLIDTLSTTEIINEFRKYLYENIKDNKCIICNSHISKNLMKISESTKISIIKKITDPNRMLNEHHATMLNNTCDVCKIKYNLKQRIDNYIQEKNQYKTNRQHEGYNQEREKFNNLKLSPSRMYYFMLEHTDVKNEYTSLKEMPYSDFLQSKYWYIIRGYKLYKSNYKCSLCDTTKNLRVHHKTYEYRGCEYKNLDSLIVLCDKCHRKQHNLLVEE